MAAEAILVLLLFKNRIYRTLPAFSIYLCWCLVSDAVLFFLQSLPPITYFQIYEIQLLVDSAIMFAVLVELAWSVLRPIRSSLPKRSWIGIVVLIGLAGLLLWPVAGLTLPAADLSQAGRNFFRLQQTTAILRVIVFLGMAGFSQLLAIGWRNRELQVATGLGLFSIVSLAVSVAHTHQMEGPQYHWLDVVGSASYLGALTYWVYAFTTKEAERQDFSPQMQSFLLLLGGTAKTSRIALAEFTGSKSRPKDH
jgi:hypothetical protein